MLFIPTYKKGLTMKRHTTLHKLILSILLFSLSFLALFLSHKSSAFADWYSSFVYPLFVASIGRFFGIFPFSVSEIGLYLFVILLFLSLVRMLILSVCRKISASRTESFKEKTPPYQHVILFFPTRNSDRISRHQKKNPSWSAYGSSLFLLGACLFTIYTFFCGINYGHTSFAEEYHLESGQYTLDELTSLCNELTDQLNTLSNSVDRDSDGLADMGTDLQERARTAMSSLGDTYPELSGYYPQPKTLLFPAFLSVQNLSGIYSPFTIEANYNSAMVAYNLPFTACHELSHLRGFMQEEEANFIGFLACVNADDTEFNYSGYLLGWIYATNELYESDYNTFEEIYDRLSDRVKADLSANNAFWKKYDSKVAEVSGQINDHYLKANGQSEGVKSYDRMVDLMITWFRSR